MQITMDLPVEVGIPPSDHFQQAIVVSSVVLDQLVSTCYFHPDEGSNLVGDSLKHHLLEVWFAVLGYPVKSNEVEQLF
jgi:hypothetical protein